MLDGINRNILIALSEDGRYSYIKLAEKLGLQPMTVANRVEAMLKNDIFTVRAIPNPIKLNYKVMSFVALDVELSKLDYVCEKLVDIPNISYISTMFGKFDIIFFAEYRDFETFHKLVWEKIPNIEGVKAVETFLIGSCEKGYLKSYDADKPVLVDEIDDKLINELRIDGRAKFTTLAKKLGISSATVSRRVTSLIENGVIQITIVTNPSKLGHHIVAFLGLHVELAKTSEICSRLSRYPQIPLVMTLMNGYNILALVATPNVQTLLNFITNKISRIDGVLNIETLIRGEFKKRTFLGFEDMLIYPNGHSSELDLLKENGVITTKPSKRDNR